MSKVTGSRDGADKKNEVNNGSGQKIEIEVIDAQDASDPGEALEVDEQERIEFLSEDVELMAAQNAELLDSLRRLKADFDNYRKRMIREQTRILETAEAELVKKLLPVIDNLERALGSAGESGPKGLAEGGAKVLELMLDTLARDGLEVIDPQGEPFDPEQHEAMMVVETDECPEDTVTDVVQKGYRFAGTLLRPAMVRVSCPIK